MKTTARNIAFGAALTVVVLTAIAVGVVLLGPPSEWRSQRLDEQRISDLRELSLAIEEFHAKNRTLPGSLAELETDDPWTTELADPETGDPYEYRAVSAGTYELCAVFSQDTAANVRESYPGRNSWSHPSGDYCFRLPARDAAD